MVEPLDGEIQIKRATFLEWEKWSQNSTANTGTPSKVDKAVQVAFCVGDVVSVGRNGSLIPASIGRTVGAVVEGVLVLAVAISRFVSGVISIGTGLIGCHNARKTFQKSPGLEGKGCATLNGMSSVGNISSGAGGIVVGSSQLASATAVAAIGTLILSAGAYFLFSCIAIFGSYLCYASCQFRLALLKQAAGNDSVQFGSWLETQLGLNAANRQDAQKAWDRFAFRTSETCCQHAREMIAKSKNGEKITDADTQNLINEIKRENLKRIAKSLFIIATCLIGISALALSGPFGPILFVVASVMWLILDWNWLQTKILDRLFSDLPKKATDPCNFPDSGQKANGEMTDTIPVVNPFSALYENCDSLFEPVALLQ